MNKAYLLTGGNMGNRMDFLAEGRNKIEQYCGKISHASAIYETAAWGKEDQESFLNQVLLVETKLSPVALLTAILEIEESLGRKREARYGPRTIDIDILFYNDEIIAEEGLHIPHPRMQDRRFVLMPLSELAPHKIHPVFLKSVEQLLKECPDHLPVNKIN
jgi:2-amino-4-hydroxy-6-hydroxymethyldihydropteridine diphosphokinase